MSYSNKNTKKYLLIFDFDQTIVDQDSEVELLNLIFSKELYDQIMKEIYNYDLAVIFHYPGEKEYWVTDRKHAEEYYDEYYKFCKDFNIDNYQLY